MGILDSQNQRESAYQNSIVVSVETLVEMTASNLIACMHACSVMSNSLQPCGL